MIGLFDSYLLLAAVLGVVVAYTAYGVVYRIYLSPIANFPGPKLAALTWWYEYYYDVYPQRGQYTMMLAAMHEKYGPIMRINPVQLHINTPEFYDTLYSTTLRVDKCPSTYKAFQGLPGGMFNTVDHDLHRARRAGVSQYFSVANVRRLQPVVEEKLEIYLQRLRQLAVTGEVRRLIPMISAFSSDVISTYCFGKSLNRLQHPSFDEEGFDEIHAFALSSKMLMHHSWLFRISKAIPESVLLWLGGAIATVTKMQQTSRNLILRTMEEKKGNPEMSAHRTIFHEALSSNLPEAEKKVDRLADEATGITFAAGETIAFTLAVITYHLLSNPPILRKLKLELQAASNEIDASGNQIIRDRLPYLTAVIKEGLRLSYGVPGILPRVLWKSVTFDDGNREWVIPTGTSVGMSSATIHHNDRIFPNSHAFNPERWIENPRLDRFLVAFSKGTRQCVGMNLANAEMYHWLASIFRHFGSKEVRFDSDEGILELVDTNIDDVNIVADFFLPEIKKGRLGPRIRVSL